MLLDLFYFEHSGQAQIEAVWNAPWFASTTSGKYNTQNNRRILYVQWGQFFLLQSFLESKPDNKRSYPHVLSAELMGETIHKQEPVSLLNPCFQACFLYDQHFFSPLLLFAGFEMMKEMMFHVTWVLWRVFEGWDYLEQMCLGWIGRAW